MRNNVLAVVAICALLMSVVMTVQLYNAVALNNAFANDSQTITGQIRSIRFVGKNAEVGFSYEVNGLEYRNKQDVSQLFFNSRIRPLLDPEYNDTSIYFGEEYGEFVYFPVTYLPNKASQSRIEATGPHRSTIFYGGMLALSLGIATVTSRSLLALDFSKKVLTPQPANFTYNQDRKTKQRRFLS